MTPPPSYSSVTEKKKKHKRPSEIFYEDHYDDDKENDYPRYVYKDTNSYEDSTIGKDDDDNVGNKFNIKKDTVFAVNNKNRLLDALGKDLKKYFRKSVLHECFCSALSNTVSRNETNIALVIILCLCYNLFYKLLC